MLKKLALTLFLILTLSASGCGKLPEGAGRWPKIEVSAPVKFSPEEQVVLAKFATDNPELAKKIIGRNNELAEAISKYNEKAREVNRNILKAVGFSDQEINKLEP